MKQPTETRGRPRDALYAAVVEDVKKKVARHPHTANSACYEWSYDIFKGNRNLRARYLGFRQSTTYKELKTFLAEKGYTSSLFFSENQVIIRVLSHGKNV